MAYILILNPVILIANAEGTDITIGGIAAGTALVAGVLSIMMGLLANFPMAMAAGMGLNAMVAFSLGLGLGLTYQEAMGVVFWEGVLILVLVLTGFREAVFRAVPRQLRSAISVGIGLFIAFVGLINAGIVRPGGTPVQLGVDGSLAGWPALAFVVGLMIIIILYSRKVKGAILIGIAGATALAFVIQEFVHVPVVSDEVPGGWQSSVPEVQGALIQAPNFNTIFQIDFFGAFTKLGWLPVLLLIFSLMLADFFDTMGTMVAVGAEGNLLDQDGVPHGSRAPSCRFAGGHCWRVGRSVFQHGLRRVIGRCGGGNSDWPRLSFHGGPLLAVDPFCPSGCFSPRRSRVHGPRFRRVSDDDASH